MVQTPTCPDIKIKEFNIDGPVNSYYHFEPHFCKT